MALFDSTHDYPIGSDSTVCRENYRTITLAVLGLDSLGDVDFAVGHDGNPSLSGISLGITDSQMLDYKGNGAEEGTSHRTVLEFTSVRGKTRHPHWV